MLRDRFNLGHCLAVGTFCGRFRTVSYVNLYFIKIQFAFAVVWAITSNKLVDGVQKDRAFQFADPITKRTLNALVEAVVADDGFAAVRHERLVSYGLALLA